MFAKEVYMVLFLIEVKILVDNALYLCVDGNELWLMRRYDEVLSKHYLFREPQRQSVVWCFAGNIVSVWCLHMRVLKVCRQSRNTLVCLSAR